ncbi:putative bifunctional diguanylate cyclase/phosphodiesterase [Rhodovulum sulfidophilum]|uniref:putative bifunctional diguanylate cyclase/phosphodiesterase n=1 Tax=Rhodovulum sulfidophilum TaxID=35806 RepID=UPI001F32EA02|nr:EAL domain-containing protein [Rhodovulum sulfidophilum]MCE8441213.1 EAL domain-containing protein [Rhodovulum sulfidophilum]
MTWLDVDRRFLLLTAAGYLTALAAIAAALWLVAIPTLHKLHRAALETQAQTRAAGVQDELTLVLADARTLAEAPGTAAYLAGSGRVRPTQMRRDLERLVDGMTAQALLFDRRGNVRLRVPGRIGHPVFGLAETRQGLSLLESGRLGGAPIVSYRPGKTPVESAFLISLPILSDGQPRGMLVIEKHLDLSRVLAGDAVSAATRLATGFQVRMYPDWTGDRDDLIAAPVAGTDFYVMIARNTGLTARLAWEMGSEVFLFTGFALLLPFMAMGLAGHRFIVAPHRALEDSRRRLTAQKAELAELAQIARMSHDSIMVSDRDRRIVWTNPAFLTLTGYAAEEVLGRDADALLQGPGSDPAVSRTLREAIAEKRPVRAEILNYRRDGTPFWAYLSITPIFDNHGQVTRFAAISSDITRRKAYEAQLEAARHKLEQQALQDSLTGLPNRRALENLFEELASEADPRTIIRIDLDHFKNVNDTHGHAAGDHVLIRIAEILREGIAPGDVAARIGGDEFVILLGPGRDALEAQAMAERLRDEILRDIPFQNKTCRIGASFGICAADKRLVDNSALLVSADAALYASKDGGRNAITLYTPSLHRDVQQKRRLALEIEHAVLREEFLPYFQPQFDAATHALVGIETLARWRHPLRGILTPAAFLGLAGQMSVLPEIDRIIYRKGLEEVAAINRAGFSIPKVSFNAGVAQLRDTDLPGIAATIDIGPTRIALEVLESVLVEEQSDEFGFHIDLLREQGFGIEIDDFGSGHASVVGLMQLAPDVMKIDQRLVVPVTRTERARRLVRSIVDIGRTFGIGVTAEGVETSAHAEILAGLGCDTLQGFHFARPLAADDFCARLAAGRFGDRRPGASSVA